MITVNLTYAGVRLEDGRHRVHLYVTTENDNGFDLSPREERNATLDAEQVVRDILHSRKDQTSTEKLLQPGEPVGDIICRAKVVIRWDKKLKMATYHNGGHERFLWDGKWQPIAQLMMEQLEYTMSVLRNREKATRRLKTA